MLKITITDTESGFVQEFETRLVNAFILTANGVQSVCLGKGSPFDIVQVFGAMDSMKAHIINQRPEVALIKALRKLYPDDETVIDQSELLRTAMQKKEGGDNG